MSESNQAKKGLLLYQLGWAQSPLANRQCSANAVNSRKAFCGCTWNECCTTLIFFSLLFWERKGKPHSGRHLFLLSAEPPKSLGKKGQTLKKARKVLAICNGISRKSNQTKEDRGNERQSHDSNFSHRNERRVHEDQFLCLGGDMTANKC